MRRAFRIPESELAFTFARSSGPGGQNVNKVATKALLRWDYLRSAALTESDKQRLAGSPLFRRRVNADGIVLIQEQGDRHQGENRRRAVEKLEELVEKTLAQRRRRVPTAPHSGAKRKRLDAKRLAARRKRDRGWKSGRGAGED